MNKSFWLSFLLLVLNASVFAGTKTILLIGHKPDHPPKAHVYLPTCELLAKCLRQTVGVETVVSNEWPKDEKVAERADALVLYTNPGAERTLQGSGAKAFEAMMKRGAGLVAIHWATGINKRNFPRFGDKWIDYLGGAWISLSASVTFGESPLMQVDPKHPICRGWKQYVLADEWYFNPIVGKNSSVLLKVNHDGKDLPVAWTTERPNGGRSFGTTIGHFHRNFGNDPFRKMIVNGILWSAKLKVPEQGGPCELAPDDPLFPKP